MVARVVNEAEHALRRDAFLDAAQRLVRTKGYERMTVQDVLDDLQMSKGAFYHYFDSKQALLAALVDRMSRETEALLMSLAYDPHLPALDKLQSFRAALARWKTAHKDFLLALLRTWHADDNAAMRQKTRAAIAVRITPLLTVIIRQGVQEGVLATRYPDTVAGVVTSLIQDLNDTLGGLLLSQSPGRDALQLAERTVATYSDALERVLGAPSGSLSLAEAEMLEAWFVSPVSKEATQP